MHMVSNQSRSQPRLFMLVKYLTDALRDRGSSFPSYQQERVGILKNLARPHPKAASAKYSILFSCHLARLGISQRIGFNMF